jgi:hypothetical protein
MILNLHIKYITLYQHKASLMCKSYIYKHKQLLPSLEGVVTVMIVRPTHPKIKTNKYPNDINHSVRWITIEMLSVNVYLCCNMHFSTCITLEEEFEDTKGVIRSHKSKDRQFVFFKPLYMTSQLNWKRSKMNFLIFHQILWNFLFKMLLFTSPLRKLC